MAVVKETKQFRIGAIGIARASEGGGIIGRQAEETFSGLAKLAYERAAVNAEKTGMEAAQAAIIIDPETGMPTPLKAPKGYGTIAADAFNRIAQNRFQNSIDSEIKVKGFELSNKYKNNRNGAALYSTAMKDYLTAMEDSAEGPGYKAYIKDLGQAYHDGTVADLTAKQADRERAELVQASKERRLEGLEAIEHQVFIDGANSESLSVMISQVNTGVDDAVSAQFFSRSARKSHDKDVNLAIARGQLKRAMQTETDPVVLAKLRDAIDSGIAALVPDEFSEIRETMKSFGSDLTSMNSYSQFGTEALNDIISFRSIQEQEREERQRQESVETLFSGQTTFPARLAGAQNTAFTIGDDAAEITTYGRTATSAFDVSMRKANAYIRDGRPGTVQIAESLRAEAYAFVGARVNGLAQNMVQDLLIEPEGSGLRLAAVLEAIKTGEFPDEYKGTQTYAHLKNFQKLFDAKYDKDGSLKSGVQSYIQGILNVTDEARAAFLSFGPRDIALIENKSFRSVDANGEPISEAGIIDDLFETILELNDKAATFGDAGMGSSADEVRATAQSTIDATAKGLMNRALSGLDVNQTERLQKAIGDQNSSIAPESAQAALAAILDMRGVSPNILTTFNTMARTWKEAGGKENTKIKKALNSQLRVQDSSTVNRVYTPYVNSISYETDPAVIGDRVLSVLTSLKSFPNLPEAERDAFINKATENGATALVNAFIGTDPSEEQLDNFAALFNKSLDVESLTPQQAMLITRAREYAEGLYGGDDQRNALLTDFKTIISNQKSKIAAQEKLFEDNTKLINILNGNFPASDESSALLEQHFDNFVGGDFREFISQSGWSTTPEGQRAIYDMSQAGQFPTSMNDKFELLAGGQMQGFQDTLSVWSNVKNKSYEGSEFSTRGADALDAKTVAALNYLESATSVLGYNEEDVARIVANRAEIERGGQAANLFNQWAGIKTGANVNQQDRVTLNDIIFSSKVLQGMPQSAVDAAKAMFIEQGMMSVSDAKGAKTAQIILNEISEDMRKRYKLTDTYVIPMGTNSRTDATLGQAAPNYPDEFKSYIEQTISKATGVAGVTLNSGIRTKDIGSFFLEPLGLMQNGNVAYQAYERISQNDGGRRMVYSVTDEFGRRVPLIISNFDLAWTSKVEQLNERAAERELNIAETAAYKATPAYKAATKARIKEEVSNQLSTDRNNPYMIGAGATGAVPPSLR